MRRRSDRGEFDATDRVIAALMGLFLSLYLVGSHITRKMMWGDIRAIKEAVTLYAPPAEPAEEVPDVDD